MLRKPSDPIPSVNFRHSVGSDPRHRLRGACGDGDPEAGHLDTMLDLCIVLWIETLQHADARKLSNITNFAV